MFVRFPFDEPKPYWICLADDDDPAKQPPGGGGEGDEGKGGDVAGADKGAGDGSPAGDDAAAAAAAAAAAEGTPKPDWRDRQIDRQHRKIKDLETNAAKAEELAAENERLRRMVEAQTRAAPKDGESGERPAPKPEARTEPEPKKPVAPGDPVAAARFQIGVENVSIALQRDYAKDWGVAQKNFEKIGGVDPKVMEAILDTDDPAYVLVTLGKNPDNYQNMLDLTPGRLRNELFKIAQEKAAKAAPAPKPKPSNAPNPTGDLPTGGTAPAGSVDLYDKAVDDNAWYAERMRQKRESAGRPWSVGGRAGGR